MERLTIIGNLTADPVLRVVNTREAQSSVTDFTVAVNKVIKGNSTTKYFRVTCWNKMAENAEKYLRKGSKVFVAGEVNAKSYEGRDGKTYTYIDVNATEIEFLSKASSDQSQNGNHVPEKAPDDGFMKIPEGADSELPFN